MMRSQPMLVVSDVEEASRWFQRVLGLESAHGGPEYEMLMSGVGDDRQLVLQLHEWDVHEHPHIGDPSVEARGNGIVVWFGADTIDDVASRAEGDDVLEAPHFNPLSHQHEIWLRGPEGYVIVVSGGSAAGNPNDAAG